MSDLDSLVRVASEMAANQARLEAEIRKLLIAGDEKQALVLVRKLVGLYDEPPKPCKEANHAARN